MSRGLLSSPRAKGEDMAETERVGEQGKRPYEAPAIASEQIFETTALACGKRMGQGAKCNVRPKAS
jgi:hypothetical protein